MPQLPWPLSPVFNTVAHPGQPPERFPRHILKVSQGPSVQAGGSISGLGGIGHQDICCDFRQLKKRCEHCGAAVKVNIFCPKCDKTMILKSDLYMWASLFECKIQWTIQR